MSDYKDINLWTRKEFIALEELPWDKKVICNSLIILPERYLHDSGYTCMSFVPVGDDGPMGKLGGSSDVIHIEGIGGYGYDWLPIYGKVPTSVKPKDWSIDCLKKSRLLRIFVHGYRLICGPSFSSFEIWSGSLRKPQNIPQNETE